MTARRNAFILYKTNLSGIIFTLSGIIINTIRRLIGRCNRYFRRWLYFNPSGFRYDPFLWPFRVFGHGLYTKKKLLQYLDIVGVVFSLSGFIQLLGDPPGILLTELPHWYLKLYIFCFKHIPWFNPLFSTCFCGNLLMENTEGKDNIFSIIDEIYNQNYSILK